MNAICPTCDGEGKVEHHAFENGITQSEREEMGEDEFRSYMRGDYDQPCPQCKCSGIVVVPNQDAMSTKQADFYALWIQEQIDLEEGEAAFRAEQRAERAFGC